MSIAIMLSSAVAEMLGEGIKTTKVNLRR